jgi:hypothetical protein
MIIENMDAVAGNKQIQSACENISTNVLASPVTTVSAEAITSANVQP